MTNAKNVAEAITEYQKRERRSTAWLSEATGIADKTLRRRMNAPDDFKLSELSAIATALGTDMETLVTFTADAEAVAALEDRAKQNSEKVAA